MESVVESLKMAASQDDNLLWVRLQPGGNRKQCFLQRKDIYCNDTIKAQTETKNLDDYTHQNG